MSGALTDPPRRFSPHSTVRYPPRHMRGRGIPAHGGRPGAPRTWENPLDSPWAHGSLFARVKFRASHVGL